MSNMFNKSLFLISMIIVSCNNDDKFVLWNTYSGDPSGSKYSSLNEINTQNVKKLKKLLWTYELFDKNEEHRNGIQSNPIIIDGRIYLIGLILTSTQLIVKTEL